MSAHFSSHAYTKCTFIENDPSPSVIKGNSTSPFIHWKCNATDVKFFIFILRIKYEFVLLVYVFKNIICLFDVYWSKVFTIFFPWYL